MGCIIIKGVNTPECPDRFSPAGVQRDDIYLFNHSEISAITGITEGEVNAITFSPSYETGFKLAIHKDSGQLVDRLITSDEAAPFYEQEFTARIISNDTDTRNALEGFVDVDLVIVIKLRNGKYKVIGESGGVKLRENENDSGKTSGDSVGDTLMFKGVESHKTNFFLDTDEATTKITLDGYL